MSFIQIPSQSTGMVIQSSEKDTVARFSEINCSPTFKTTSTAKQRRKIVLFQKQL